MDAKELQPVLDYLDNFKTEVNQRFNVLENKVDDLQTSVDSLAKMVKDFHEEMIVTRKRLDILEDWAKKVSEKIGIPLPL